MNGEEHPDVVHDPLLDYRVRKLEEAVEKLSEVLATLAASVGEITYTLRSGRMAVIVLFGIVQPVVLAVVINQLIGHK